MLPLGAGLGISCGAQLLVLVHVTKFDATLRELVSELSQRLVQRVVHPHDHIGSPLPCSCSGRRIVQRHGLAFASHRHREGFNHGYRDTVWSSHDHEQEPMLRTGRIHRTPSLQYDAADQAVAKLRAYFTPLSGTNDGYTGGVLD